MGPVGRGCSAVAGSAGLSLWGGPAVGGGPAAVRHHAEDPDDDYVVMTDPEGNESCGSAVASRSGGVVNEARL